MDFFLSWITSFDASRSSQLIKFSLIPRFGAAAPQHQWVPSLVGLFGCVVDKNMAIYLVELFILQW